MSIRTKMIALLALLFVILILIEIGVQESVLLPSFAELERDDAKVSMKRIDYALDMTLAQLESSAADWGNWIDVYRFVQSQDRDFVENNMTQVTMKELQLNALAIIGLDGRIVSSLAQDLETGRTLDLDFTAVKALPRDFPWRANLLNGKAAKGLMQTNRGVMMMTAAPIMNGTGTGDHRGMVIMGQDNVVLIDSATGKVLQAFDLSTSDLIPSSFPYTCVATRDGHRAWCSLWNASQVVELDLAAGAVGRRISLKEPDDRLAPGSHPTALLLSPDEKTLYVALSNADYVAAVSTSGMPPEVYLSTNASGQERHGTYPTSLALSGDGRRLFVADSSLNAVAVFDTSQQLESWKDLSGTRPLLGFIPTDWYPSAIAVHSDDLLIATAKGEGTRPNKDMGKTVYETKHKEHPYIPTLLRGSIARLNIPSTLEKLPQLTEIVERDNLFHNDPGTISFAAGQNPIKHVIYVIKENRTFDQILGDLKVGDADPSLNMYGEDITPNEHKLARQFGVLDNFYDSGEVSSCTQA